MAGLGGAEHRARSRVSAGGCGCCSWKVCRGMSESQTCGQPLSAEGSHPSVHPFWLGPPRAALASPEGPGESLCHSSGAFSLHRQRPFPPGAAFRLHVSDEQVNSVCGSSSKGGIFLLGGRPGVRDLRILLTVVTPAAAPRRGPSSEFPLLRIQKVHDPSPTCQELGRALPACPASRPPGSPHL